MWDSVADDPGWSGVHTPLAKENFSSVHVWIPFSLIFCFHYMLSSLLFPSFFSHPQFFQITYALRRYISIPFPATEFTSSAKRKLVDVFVEFETLFENGILLDV